MKEHWNRKRVKFSRSCSVRITQREDPVIQKRGLRAPDGEAASLREGPCSWAANESRAADRGPPAGAKMPIWLRSHFLWWMFDPKLRSLRGDIILTHSSFFLFYSMNFMGRMSMFQHCPSTLRLCRENSLIYQRFYCTWLPRKSLNSAHNVCVPIEYSQRYAEAI